MSRLLQSLTGLASVASKFPNLFPETLEVDDNAAYWVTQTPDYQARPHLRESITADVAIIGAGFTGMSTAYHLSERHPNLRIVVLDAKTLANGASGRNGGMMLNWLADNPDDDALLQRIYAMTHDGVRWIGERIQQHGLQVQHRQDGTLTVYTDARRAEAAQRETEHLQTLGIPVQYIDANILRQQLHLEGTHGAVLDPHSGQLNGAQFVRGLRPVLEARGVQFYEHTPVLKVREGARIQLETPFGSVTAKSIVLATNGYTSKLGYFKDALFPLHSHVFASAPLSPEQLAALGWHRYAGWSDDYDRISYASLTPDGVLVFGGGSNASYAYQFNNRTVYQGSSQRGQRAMEQTLKRYMPPFAQVPIRQRWTGTLGITFHRQTLMGRRGSANNVYYAIGFNGHGVVMGNVAGRVIADLYDGDISTWRGMPFLMPDGKPTYPLIPPEPMRYLGYLMFTRLTGKSPRV